MLTSYSVIGRSLARVRVGLLLLVAGVVVGCRFGYEVVDDSVWALGSGGESSTTGGSDGGLVGGGTATGGTRAGGGTSGGATGSVGGAQSMAGAGPGGGGDPGASAGGVGAGSLGGMAGAIGMGGAGGCLANSVAQFSDVQGRAGWQYGYFRAPDFGVADFIAMTEFGPIDNLGEDGWFVSADYWTAISASGMHPNGASTTAPKLAEEHHAVRRWTSTESGTLTLRGRLFAFDGSFNGTLASVRVEGQEILALMAPPGQTEAIDFEAPITFELGDRVDFVLDPVDGADQADSTRLEVEICR